MNKFEAIALATAPLWVVPSVVAFVMVVVKALHNLGHWTF